MVKTIHAIFEGGVFRPVEAVDLPDRTRVEFDLRLSPEPLSKPMSPGLARVYEILGRQHNSGHSDTAERHNEHQP